MADQNMTFYWNGRFSSICILSGDINDLYITKSCGFCWYLLPTKEYRYFWQKIDFFDHLTTHQEGNLKSGYYIVPNSSTILIIIQSLAAFNSGNN